VVVKERGEGDVSSSRAFGLSARRNPLRMVFGDCSGSAEGCVPFVASTSFISGLRSTSPMRRPFGLAFSPSRSDVVAVLRAEADRLLLDLAVCRLRADVVACGAGVVVDTLGWKKRSAATPNAGESLDASVVVVVVAAAAAAAALSGAACSQALAEKGVG